jgi:putative ABC transport system substrate-binding protein
LETCRGYGGYIAAATGTRLSCAHRKKPLPAPDSSFVESLGREKLMVRRRELITLLCGAVTWPLVAARAQQPAMARRIGVLLGWLPGTPQAGPFLATFAKALRELGWIENRNMQIDYRFAGSDPTRIQTFAKELVNLQPDLIVGHSTPIAAALQHETRTIPIVFVTVSDPVGSGFVASLPRPGGNMTGFINLEASLGGKWIELLKEVAPGITRVALTFNPQTAPYSDYYLRPFESAARSFSLELVPAVIRSSEDIERAVTSLGGGAGGGLAVMPDIFAAEQKNLDLIIGLAARHRVPTIYPYRYMAAAGGLISYGIDNGDLWRRAPTYIDRILKGAKPNDLPVQLPTKFELAVNLKAAKALGLDVPLHLQQLADEVIE